MTEYEKYADKALAIHNTTYKKVIEKSTDGEIEVEIGKKKKKMMWSDYYTFTEEQFKSWKEFVMKDLKIKNPQLTEDSILILFSEIDMLYGLGQPYLFLIETNIESPTQLLLDDNAGY